MKLEYLNSFTGKPGIIYTQFTRCMNVLTLYGGGELLGDEKIKETDNPEDLPCLFYKIKVNDLRQAYLIIDDIMISDFGYLW